MPQAETRFARDVGGKGHHIKECTSKVEFVGAMVEYDSEVKHQAF